MGVVYRAFDLQLERPVALKLLHDDAAAAHGRRLLLEARHASRLSHPGVCTVHEIVEDSGRTFIVMELVPGQPLAEVIPAGGLPPETLIHYAVQITDAVAHAHDRGVLHRDLKSANVMVLPDSRTKILDFGIAELMDVDREAATHSLEYSGLSGIRGTLAYLAPEVLSGQPADPRSDIWSLGVLLYELATGKLPFIGETAFALTSAILTAPVPSLSGRVPAGLAALIAKTLAKDPRVRFGSARELLAVLESLHSARASASDVRAGRAIAVLPFKDLARSRDDEHLGLGLADAIITELAGARAIIVRPTSAIVRYRDATDPRAAGRELGVDAVLEGNFQRVGSRLRITAQLSDVADGRSLWGTRLATSIDDLFALQDEVARQVAAALQIELADADDRSAGRTRLPASDAYDDYLRGRVRLLTENRTEVTDAVAAFERATTADPGFAQAWAALSDACLRMAFTWEPDAGWYERAERACDRALALDPELPEGRHSHGRLLWTPRRGFRHADAIRALTTALKGRPNMNEAHQWLGLILLHVGMLQESRLHFHRALAIAPEDFVAGLHLGLVSYLEGDFETARRVSEDGRQRHPATHWIHYQLAMSYIQLGALIEAQAAVALWAQVIPGDVLHLPVLGILAALRGEAREAERLIAATDAARRSFGHYHHAQYDVGCIYALLGKADEAIRWVGDAARNGFPCSVFFRRDPLLASIWPEARFQRLMDEVDVECAGYAVVYRSQLG